MFYRYLCVGGNSNAYRQLSLDDIGGCTVRTIVCHKCAKKFNLIELYNKANLCVIGGQGRESNCGLCGEPNGGSDIIIPQEIMEQARKSNIMKNIFVTGESGTIPMQIQFLAKEFNFNIINSQLEKNFLTGLKSHQSFKVRKPEIDFLQRDFLLNLTELWEQVDLIIHSGAFVGTDFCSSDPTMAIRTNVEGTQNIVDICNKFNIPIIYLSTTAILDPKNYSYTCPMTESTPINPQTLYGITKYAGELIVKNTCNTKKLILRPVFGFGNYPDDLHSALTKSIYLIYKNIVKRSDNNLTILLDPLINKSYTRVENIATCILRIAEEVVFSKNIINNVFNIGENHTKSKDWLQIYEIIINEFTKRNISSYSNIKKIIDKNIKFIPEKDYLHYHNINNYLLCSYSLDFDSQEKYISIEKGISMTVESVIKNIEMEPYWL